MATRKILCTICATLALGACSYFETGEAIDVTAEGPETIDLMAGPAGEASFSDYAAAERRATGGRVEVYGLEESFEGPPSLTPIVPTRGGASPNPSVEVFPLDTGMTEVVSAQYLPPGVAPPPPAAFQRPSAPAMPVEQVQTLPLWGQGFSAPVALPGSQATSVYFGHDSAALSAEAKGALSAVAESYEGERQLSVEGYASRRSSIEDPIKRKIANLKISMNRAFAASRALIEDGVPAESIRTVGWGEAKAPDGPETPESESLERRVEIIPYSGQ